MNIAEITVSAGRTIPHPTTDYANLKAFVTLKATLEAGEDVDAAVKALQAKAEKHVEDHKNALVDNIVMLQRISHEEAEITDLERRIQQSQARIQDIRAARQAKPAGELQARLDEAIAEQDALADKIASGEDAPLVGGDPFDDAESYPPYSGKEFL